MQASYLRDVCWIYLSFDFGFAPGFEPCRLRPCTSFKNIGIEFKPDWWDLKNEDWKEGVLMCLSNMVRQTWCKVVDTLWIIDHGLERSREAPTIEEMSAEYDYRVFYASDRKLVEVNDGNARHFTDSNPEALDKEGQPLLNYSVALAWRLVQDGHPVSVLGWDNLEAGTAGARQVLSIIALRTALLEEAAAKEAEEKKKEEKEAEAN
ncbi:hypothetical protein NW768_010936 [Fusarium equiseti]|uniref:Uncharacterized protein n=1 Tax=Fusarium equiseti TaxID=61235 RepID=A0ABQ8QZ32_FUSEQ|nr:hypothetical protein NW768_010936 [Fusarium equiseti]